MRKFAFVCLCVAGTSGAVADSRAEAAVAMKGEALRQAVTGKTIYISTPLGELPIRYSANGTMTGSASAYLASMAGETASKDKGEWWISGDRLCQKWQNWLEKQSFCYHMSRSGSGVSWRRSDGVTGTARIGS